MYFGEFSFTELLNEPLSLSHMPVEQKLMILVVILAGIKIYWHYSATCSHASIVIFVRFTLFDRFVRSFTLGVL